MARKIISLYEDCSHHVKLSECNNRAIKNVLQSQASVASIECGTVLLDKVTHKSGHNAVSGGVAPRCPVATARSAPRNGIHPIVVYLDGMVDLIC